MDLREPLARARGLLLKPRATWPLIAAERTTAGSLYRRYVLLLAAVPAVATFIRLSTFGERMPYAGTVRLRPGAALASGLGNYVSSLLCVYLVALIVAALAPLFGARRDAMQSLRLVAYASTAVWVAGLGYLLPVISALVQVAGASYAICLLYLGLPVTMQCPPRRVAGYTALIVLAGIVVRVMVGALLSGLGGLR